MVRARFRKSQENFPSKIYFFDDNKIYGVPENYLIEYRSGSRWEKVNVKSMLPAIPEGNTVNIVNFNTVTASGIKFIFQNNSKNTAIAVAEIKVY